MRIAIGTLNKAKNDAVREVINEVWKGAEFYSIETNSQVRNQPLSDEEGILGAINRAKQSLKKTNSDYGIGLEGFVHDNKNGMFMGGAVVILNKNLEYGIGTSALVELPESIAIRIRQGEELGPIIQGMFNDDKNLIRHSDGTNGILTKGLYTRVKEFQDATKCALARFVAPELYK